MKLICRLCSRPLAPEDEYYVCHTPKCPNEGHVLTLWGRDVGYAEIPMEATP